MKTALLVVDVQQSFRQRPCWQDEHAKPFLVNVQRLINQARNAHVPILQIFHSEEDEGPTGAFSRHSGHVRAMPELDLDATEVFHKNVHSSLYGKAANGKTLETWLRDNEIGHVVVTGIRTEQCCETTTRHASDAGFKVTYALDATLTFPMVSQSGRTFTPAEIAERTAMVLHNRFAQVVPSEAVVM